MKSQHRHELQTNELSKLAARATEWYEAYHMKAGIVVAVICLVSAVVIYFVRSAQAERAAGWAAFAACRTAEDYANVAEDFAGTDVGLWASLLEAENHLQQGLQLMFTDRPAAISDLKASEKAFETVLNHKSAPAEVRERALFGMAALREAISDGETGSAIELYKKLVNEFPESVYRELAEQRIDDLQSGSSQEFYAWFHQQNPQPKDLDLPSDLEVPAGDAKRESAEKENNPSNGQPKENVSFPPAPDSSNSPKAVPSNTAPESKHEASEDSDPKSGGGSPEKPSADSKPPNSKSTDTPPKNPQ